MRKEIEEKLRKSVPTFVTKVDAIKLQTYTPDTITLDIRDNEFIINDEKEKLNKSIEVIVEKDEQLIGGATIRVGDHMIDGSVRSQLSNLNRFLIN